MHITYDVPNWNKNHYQDQKPVRACARAWAMTHEKKRGEAVLLCHGFTGYPGELVRPGLDLYEAGFDVFCPRYPGHGTSASDFLLSKAEDWIGTAYDAFSDLAQQYDRVLLVGHSMGGAIATVIADAFDVDALVLLAPALVIPSLVASKVRLAKYFIKRRKTGWQQDKEYVFHYEGDEGDDLYLGTEYWSYTFPAGVWELERVRRQAVACIDHLRADTLSLSGGLDKTIPQEASVLVTSKPQGVNKHLHLESASHLMPYDKNLAAQDEAMKAVVDWLSGIR